MSLFSEHIEYRRNTNDMSNLMTVDAGFYSMNLLMIGKTYLRLKDKDKAKEYLLRAREYPIRTEDDKKVLMLICCVIVASHVFDITRQISYLTWQNFWFKSVHFTCIQSRGGVRSCVCSVCQLAKLFAYSFNLLNVFVMFVGSQRVVGASTRSGCPIVVCNNGVIGWSQLAYYKALGLQYEVVFTVCL